MGECGAIWMVGYGGGRRPFSEAIFRQAMRTKGGRGGSEVLRVGGGTPECWRVGQRDGKVTLPGFDDLALLGSSWPHPRCIFDGLARPYQAPDSGLLG